MKLRIFFAAAFVGSMVLSALTSCDTDTETTPVQNIFSHDEQYYKNLRDYKKSDHELYYAYYQHWAPLEGVEGSKDPASWGERIIGLPDSVDLVNLWIGIPTPETHPVAYMDMRYAQEKLGTRFIHHVDAAHFHHKFWYRDEDFNVDESRIIDLDEDHSDEAIRAYARWAVDTVMKCGLDGVDYDCEGWADHYILTAIEETYKYFGPEGRWPEKLIMLDYFNSYPTADCDPYVDYISKQAYSGQGATNMGAPGGWPEEKMIYLEAFHQKPDGGYVWTYARWEPTTGHKGGVGSYSTRFNYNQTKNGVPYQAIRESIQIMNPALHN